MYRSNALPLCLIALAAVIPVGGQAVSSNGYFPRQEAGQNWNNPIFRHLDQGSRLMPEDWFNKLKLGDKQFADGLDRYGFIYNPKDNNPLPIGFATNSNEFDKKAWVGLTCAACHSGRIDHNKISYIVDGAPSLIDFDKFLEDVVIAMDDTLKPANWDQFARNFPGDDKLRDRFMDLTTELQVRQRINAPPKKAGPSGRGRVDAFGNIFNQVVVQHLQNPEKEHHDVDAPASYPALWDIAQHPFVQWNYSAPNLGVGSEALGSLLRNIGEVLGVFGTADITRQGSMWIYRSSANIENLKKIEGMLATLHSPKWPFALDNDKIDAGKQVYHDQGCDTCHAIINAGNPPTSYPAFPVPVDDIGTDDQLAKNFQDLRAPTRILEGAPKGPLIWTFGFDPFSISKFGSGEPVRDLTAHLALNMLVSKADQISAGTAGIASLLVLGKELRYKARPLNGVWATAPYLHNGSVPNLVELLKPDSIRMQKFCVGDHEYDLINVGYLTHEEDLIKNDKCPDGTTLLNTKLRGSRNTGHPYGTKLLQTDKENLIEFLKSL
jgi:processive rubber oxygenase RoxA-like protein